MLTREELKAHCERQIEQCEMLAKHSGKEPGGRIYEEHKLVLELLDQESILDKIRAEIEALNPVDYVSMSSYEGHRGASDMKDDVLRIIDKYREEQANGEH